MRINDVIMLSFDATKKNKKQIIISSIIFLMVSLLFMFISYLGISSKKNFNNAYYEYIKKTPIVMSIDSVDCINEKTKKILSNKSIFQMSSVYTHKQEYYFYDFRLNNTDSFINKKIEPNTNQILLNDSYSDEFEINDTIIIEDISYIIVDFYQYDDFAYDCILDLTYAINNSKIYGLSIEYNYKDGDNVSQKLKSVINIAKNMKANFEKDELRMEEVDLCISSSDYSIVLTLICFLIAAISFIISFVIIHNSISMYVDQSRYMIGLFRIYGSKKRFSTIFVWMQLLLSIVAGVITSTLIIVVFSPNFRNINQFFIELIDNGIYSSIKGTFNYNSSFIWYLPIITFLMYSLASYIDIYFCVKKLYKNSTIQMFD